MTAKSDQSVYDKLRLHYNKEGSAAVRKILLQILKLRFTPEEAELALIIPNDSVEGGTITIGELVEKSGLDESQVRNMVDQMTQKGIIQWQRNPENTDWRKDLQKEDSVQLFDFDYSMYTPMVGDGTTDDMKLKVTELREKLCQLGFSLQDTDLESSRYPIARWLPAEDFIDPSDKLEPWESFSHFIEQAWLITAVACGCRATSHKCNRSVYSCFHFDDDAYHWVNYMGARPLTKEEAIQLQKDVQKEDGLVCQGENHQEMPTAICSCCGDDCVWLRPYNEQNHPGPFVKSNFLPQWDMEKCNRCFICKDACPVGAIVRHISHHDDEKDSPQVMEHRCIGCGVCAASCPCQVILLKRVRNEIPVKTLDELIAKQGGVQ